MVLVDRSSTLPNRELVRLARYVEGAGAALRLVGDPAQPSPVAAGGGWRALLERHPHDRAELTERRRQVGPEMAEVRMVLVDYAAGQITEAIERLRRDDRVVEADMPDELFDKLVATGRWTACGGRRSPERDPSSMVADHHW